MFLRPHLSHWVVLVVYQERSLAFPWPRKRPGTPVIPTRHLSLHQGFPQPHAPNPEGEGEGEGEQIPTVSGLQETELIPAGPSPLPDPFSRGSSRGSSGQQAPHSLPGGSPFPPGQPEVPTQWPAPNPHWPSIFPRPIQAPSVQSLKSSAEQDSAHPLRLLCESVKVIKLSC